MNGIICIYKEKGMTSFDVVAKIRRIYKTKKVGHGGTLDPMAEGVLPVFVGDATKAVDFCPDDTKQYVAGFQFGITTDTQDITGKVLSTCDAYVSRNKMPMIERVFTGEQLQTPPMYSAVKVNGQRLYDLARKGEVVNRQPRNITVYELKVQKYEYNSGEMSVTCSKGTYIRTLIHDIGQKLETGAVMTSLVRVRSGVFTLDDCYRLNELESKAEDELESLLMPLEKLYGQLPKARLDEKQTKLFRNGAVLDADRIRFDIIYDKGYYIEGADSVFLGLGKIGEKHELEVLRRFNTDSTNVMKPVAAENNYTQIKTAAERKAEKITEGFDDKTKIDDIEQSVTKNTIEKNEESIAEAVKETLEATSEEAIAEAVEETSEIPSEEAIAETTEETLEAPSEEVIAEKVEETSEMPSEEAIAEAVEETSEIPSEEANAEAVEETLEVPSEEAIAEKVEETLEIPSEEAIAETVEETSEIPSEEAIAETVEETLETPSEEAIAETVEETLEVPSKEAIAETVEETLEATSEEMTSEMVEETSEVSSEAVIAQTVKETLEVPSEEVIAETVEETSEVHFEEVIAKAVEKTLEVPSEEAISETFEETANKVSAETESMLPKQTIPESEEGAEEAEAFFVPTAGTFADEAEDDSIVAQALANIKAANGEQIMSEPDGEKNNSADKNVDIVEQAVARVTFDSTLENIFSQTSSDNGTEDKEQEKTSEQKEKAEAPGINIDNDYLAYLESAFIDDEDDFFDGERTDSDD